MTDDGEVDVLMKSDSANINGKEWKFEWRRRPESRRHRHPPGTLRIRGTTGHPQVAVGRRQSTSGDEGRARRRRAPRQSGALGPRA